MSIQFLTTFLGAISCPFFDPDGLLMHSHLSYHTHGQALSATQTEKIGIRMACLAEMGGISEPLKQHQKKHGYLPVYSFYGLEAHTNKKGNKIFLT
jgi:hypothetical protein